MTLRRYTPLKPSRGTLWPVDVRDAVYARDGGCVAPRLEPPMPESCWGQLELDHVRASGAVGMKSRSTLDNAVVLCARHHFRKTVAGRIWRPVLLDYIATRENPHAAHVDPCPECPR